MRISARAGATFPAGWLAFSTPVRVRSRAVAWSFLHLTLAVAAVIGFLLGPGLAWWARRPLGSVAVLPLPGLVLLMSLGLGAWSMRPAWSRAFLPLALLVVLGWIARRSLALEVWRRLSRTQLQALLVVLAVFLIGAGKAALSSGPPEELFDGAVNRTLEAGDRSDPMIQYHVVQIALMHRAPTTAVARELFLPYDFSARGPLVGLIATPLVGASGARLTPLSANATWELFDGQGYAVYRLVYMALAAMTLLAAFGWVEALAGARRAALATVLLAGSPFFVHEVYFIWPKLFGAYFGLLALLAIVHRRSFLAGCCLGLGYLAHPGTLFAVPLALGMLLVPRLTVKEAGSVRPTDRDWSLLLEATSVLSGLALGLVVWALVNRGRVNQGSFLEYALMAYWRPATSIHEWLVFRLHSLTHTLVPFTGLYGPPAPGGPGKGFQRLAFQPWLNLGFGVGLSALPAFLWALACAARRLRALSILVLALPLLLFTTYWGATDSGMLREGLHTWFCALVCVVAIAWPSPAGTISRVLGWLLLLRGVELGVLLLWPMALSRRPELAPYLVTDAVIASGLALLVGWLMFRTAKELTAVASVRASSLAVQPSTGVASRDGPQPG